MFASVNAEFWNVSSWKPQIGHQSLWAEAAPPPEVCVETSDPLAEADSGSGECKFCFPCGVKLTSKACTQGLHVLRVVELAYLTEEKVWAPAFTTSSCRLYTPCYLTLALSCSSPSQFCGHFNAGYASGLV